MGSYSAGGHTTSTGRQLPCSTASEDGAEHLGREAGAGVAADADDVRAKALRRLPDRLGYFVRLDHRHLCCDAARRRILVGQRTQTFPRLDKHPSVLLF